MKEKDAEVGKNKKPKGTHPSFGKNLSEYFSEYSDNTSIHGVRYLGEKKRSILERLCWFVVLAISLYLCVYLIAKTYEKWTTSPVIVSFAKSPTPVWKIPFPAITVCPETKAKQRVYNFTDAYHKYHENRDNMTEQELKEFEQVSLVCDNHLYRGGNKTIGYDAIDFLSRVAPQFSDVLWQCKWINQNQTCDTLLTPMLTEEGVCYTFNMLDREELFTNVTFLNGNYLQHGIKSMNWTLEKGYPKDLGADTFPRRAIAAGQRACFSLLMTLYEPDLDYICRGPVQGFKILIHNPVEMPRVSQQYFRAPLNQEVVVAIKPDMMTTSEGLRDYSAEDRHCYFPDEKHLKYFQVYTQRNCEVECLTNHTLEKCGCVSYHMPHDQATALCGSGSTICVHNAQAEMLAREVEMDIESFEDEDSDSESVSATNIKNKERCNCLPACTSISYNAESSQADFNWPKVFEAFKVNFSEFPGVAMTRVTFFFKEQQFITSERNELYGLTDFLANCGGLLGLFIGFSFLSVIEILYFLTLRLVCNIKKYGRHFWSGSPELVNDEDYLHDN